MAERGDELTYLTSQLRDGRVIIWLVQDGSRWYLSYNHVPFSFMDPLSMRWHNTIYNTI